MKSNSFRTKTQYRGDTIGSGPSKATWYSICSAHRMSDTSCPRCMAGQYVNDLGHEVDAALYRVAPSLWRRLANR